MSAVPYPHVVDPGLTTRALDVANRLAHDAADVLVATAGRRAASATPTTHPYDWVSDTDWTLERHTRRVLTAEFPGIPVLGAKDRAEQDARAPAMQWIVDPVDGTANYLAGLCWYAYSLALVDAAGPIIGVVADPSQDRICTAARGRGLHANGEPVRGLAATGQAAGGIICAELRPERFAAVAHHCAALGVGVRVLGSATLAITQVALGRAVAALLDDVDVSDVAAALCLAEQAGACTVEPDARIGHGYRCGLRPRELIVAAPNVLDDVLGWWQATRPEANTAARMSQHR
jgi:myo-inositol-1(or 4)-monophosphatase